MFSDPSSRVGKPWSPIWQDSETLFKRMEQETTTMEKLSTNLAEISIHGSTPPPEVYQVMPETGTTRFFDRTDFSDRIDTAFATASKQKKFQSVGLYGLGGVGKSTVAYKYVEHKFNEKELQAVFWVHGEKVMSMKQSFTSIAKELRVPDFKEQEHDDNFLLVQRWLRSTGEEHCS